MVWDQLWIDKPHLAYALIGGFVSVFSLISLFIKEKLYIGEATVATIFGLIIGPHCLNWFSPVTWGNVDYITIEVSRIVLVVQIFAVAVELPKKYMLKHWLSVAILLLPVMTFGWLISSVFIWKLIPTLSWVEGLVLAACVTATDPVLASAVVGKGKFAKRVPGHLRNILSAESGCNDGMAFPFAYLALNLIQYKGHHGEIAFHFIVITILYECVFGCIVGAVIGYAGRHLIKFTEKKNLIDRESFLVFYFVLALFCTGVGTIIGVDDLLVSFAAGTAFAWDGWFARKTEESHVSNVIDLLLNMAYFVYLGAIVPWEQFNSVAIGLSAWKLVLLAIILLLVRRIPIMLMMKPFVPDIRTWREALFCGHFGPIGVGAIFISILARAELEHDEPTPLAQLPAEGSKNYYAIATIWPVTTFLVIASIVVHGSSIAVFTLGKRLNNMTITVTYTQNATNQSSWLQRLPPIGGGRSFSFSKTDNKKESTGHRAKPAGGMKRRKKRRAVNSDYTPESRPIDLSAKPNSEEEFRSSSSDPGYDEKDQSVGINGDIAAFQEGDNIIVESPHGEVLAQVNSRDGDAETQLGHQIDGVVEGAQGSSSSTDFSTSSDNREDSEPVKKVKQSLSPSSSADREKIRRSGRKVIAYQLDDDVIVENEDGEVIKRYKINRRKDKANKNSSTTLSNTEPTTRPAPSLMDKTLALCGLKRSNNETDEAIAPKLALSATRQTVDIEDNPDTRILAPKEQRAQGSFNDEAMKKRLKEMLSRNKAKTGPLNAEEYEDSEDDLYEESPSPPRRSSVAAGSVRRSSVAVGSVRRSSAVAAEETGDLGTSQNLLGQRHDIEEEDDQEEEQEEEEDEEEEDEDEDDGDEELLPDETPAERNRRLAALGLLGGDDADDDDEEPGTLPRRQTQRDDEDEEEGPKIRFAVKK